MVVLRILFETQGSLKFDSQEVENAPSSWLGQAQQHKYKEGAAWKKLDIDYFGGMVAIIDTALSMKS